jgi:integrase
VGDKPKMTWQEAVVRYLTETDNRSRKDDLSLFRVLDQYLCKLSLHEINQDVIQSVILGRTKDGVSNTTVNRSLEKVRTILNRAKDDWRVMCDPPKIRLLPTRKKRVRWLTHNEAIRLLNALPEHTRSMAHFTLETGLRESNITSLRWDQVNLTKRIIYIEADDVLKSNKDFAVPLSDEAIEIIKSQIGKHERFVFTYKGKPVGKAGSTAWENTLARLGVDDFRWHDLRHTWATWHVQRGTPLHILQELGNWSSFDMVKRYAHFSVDHLAEYVTSGTNLAQTKKPLKLAAS